MQEKVSLRSDIWIFFPPQTQSVPFSYTPMIITHVDINVLFPQAPMAQSVTDYSCFSGTVCDL